jgi:small subunit ribosomal protein S17
MKATTTQKQSTKKRTLEGVVVSDAMNKTRVVEVVRLVKHSKYLKYFKISKRYKAHDESNEYKKSDVVKMEETQPLSRDKRWIIVGKTVKSKE